jgi:glycogen operon protein
VTGNPIDLQHVATPRSWASDEGLPYPLGLSWVSTLRAFNFALYSKHASSVRLLLFDDARFDEPRVSLTFDPLKNKSGRVWHCRVPEAMLAGSRYYAYAVDGPDPRGLFQMHAFHPEKVLLDPYALQIFFPPSFDRTAALGTRPNTGKAALCALEVDGAHFDWGDDPRPRHESEAIVYELHVKGFTQHPSAGVSAEARGTFAGVIEKVPYLLELGVNVVELMPVFQCDPQARDYWGYMPMSFFAPHRAYARDPSRATTAFREMVKALHAAGIEVVIDVVYNHTAEGGADGPIYSYKAIDNSTYYLMTNGGQPHYADYSGTGNSLNASNRYVRKMILDSMRYWVREMHVDGFRFDLASVFARNPDGSINFEEPPIFGDISSDPDFDGVRMIAEPWDATGANALGRSFPGTTWLQWNSRFRDDVRRFVRGDAGMVGALMQRLRGSDDLFPEDPESAYHAYQSVNYVTCHDGFTLYDLVAYDRKHNEANGHHNQDGADENFSWNCGVEGDEGASAAVLRLRLRQAKNLMTLLLLANGTPMLRAGDEFLNSQRGNNNPYNQDNEVGWLDWGGRDRHAGFHRFVRLMIAFRKRHPSLGRSRSWCDDAHWYGVHGLRGPISESRALALCLHGASQADDDLYVMANAADEAVTFSVQDTSGAAWRRVIDTSGDAPADFVEAWEDMPAVDGAYEVKGRSVVVLIRPRP